MVVVSCTTRSFPEVPLDRALARIAWAGFRAAELHLPPDRPLPDPGALAATLKGADLSLAAVDAGALGGEDLPAGLDSAAHIGRCAVLANRLESNRVVCDLAVASEPLAQQILSHLSAALAEVPVLLCLRNCCEEGPETRERLLRLLAANPDRLGLALNPCAAYRAGWNPLAEWERLMPSLRHLYVTNVGGPPGAAGGHEFAWDELARRLRVSGYSGALSLWQEDSMVSGNPVFAEAELKEARFLVESWFDGAV